VGMRVFQGEISTGGTQRKEMMYVSHVDEKAISPQNVFSICPRKPKTGSCLPTVPMTHFLILMKTMRSSHSPLHFTCKIQGVLWNRNPEKHLRKRIVIAIVTIKILILLIFSFDLRIKGVCWSMCVGVLYIRSLHSHISSFVPNIHK